jgi:hypothetical protein
MNDSLLKPATPRDCAIAVAIPLTFDQFCTELSEWPDKDFAHSFIRSYPKQSAANVWSAALDSIAGRVLDILREVSELGVYVHWNTKLDDLCRLFAEYRVVTVLTHWRPGWVFPNHVMDARRLADKVAEGTSRVGVLLREQLAQDWADSKTTEIEEKAYGIRFSRAANQLLKIGNFGPSGCPPSWHQSLNSSYRVHANRVVLDQEFPSELVPGNRAQFFDGMRSAKELASIVPRNFRGVFDLTVCNSVMVAEEVKRHGRVTCLANEREVDLTLRTEIYRQAIQVISEFPCEYSEAVRDVRVAMVDQLASRSSKPSILRGIFR